jgi:heme-degrading monooxygenase HmoA
MFLEIATISIKPGEEADFEAAAKKAVAVFKNSRGCDGMEMRRCVETPNRYFLFVNWRTLEDHLEHFRNDENGLAAWRKLVSRFYDGTPTLEHSVRVVDGFRNT